MMNANTAVGANKNSILQTLAKRYDVKYERSVSIKRCRELTVSEYYLKVS